VFGSEEKKNGGNEEQHSNIYYLPRRVLITYWISNYSNIINPLKKEEEN